MFGCIALIVRLLGLGLILACLNCALFSCNFKDDWRRSMELRSLLKQPFGHVAIALFFVRSASGESLSILRGDLIDEWSLLRVDSIDGARVLKLHL